MEDDDIANLYEMLFERLIILRQENSHEAIHLGTYRAQSIGINCFRFWEIVVLLSKKENLEYPTGFHITPYQAEVSSR